jgi:hypothetical protein
MIFLGYEAMMLALESNAVIGLRLMKIANGGVDAGHEVILMVQEKVAAAAEAHATLMGGGSAEAVLVGYRRRVALNAQRLSPRSSRDSPARSAVC